METNDAKNVYRGRFEVYRITTTRKTLIYAIVVDDTIVAADQVPLVGSRWNTYRQRMEGNGATFELVSVHPAGEAGDSGER